MASCTTTPGRRQARANGFSLHAGLVIPAGQRERLERVCRYALRPPVAVERLHVTEDGLVRLSLRHPWHDGTTDLVFTPMECLERLAVLVPRPRINLVLYFGVLGARAARRADIVVPGRAELAGDCEAGGVVKCRTHSSCSLTRGDDARRRAQIGVPRASS